MLPEALVEIRLRVVSLLLENPQVRTRDSSPQYRAHSVFAFFPADSQSKMRLLAV